MKKNIYSHSINLEKLTIINAPREEFSKKLNAIEYRGYEVEQCVDGCKIVITKPGGKSVYGHPKKEDFQVFIYNPNNSELWQISHKQILEDVEAKCKENPKEGKKLIELLEKTLKGEEPNNFIGDIQNLYFKTGEIPEKLIKAYKWIWGQEDVNYPNGEGRFLSWGAYEELYKSL
jgi:hypothetical protein